MAKDQLNSAEVALLVAVFLKFVWTVTVISVTTYLVFWKGHSGWWYLLALILCGSGSSSSDGDKPKGRKG